jgi:drug/metabolite transporter (DMT)-like permease
VNAAALALVLTAGLLHAAWNIATKRSGADRSFPLLSTSLMVLLWAPALLWLGVAEIANWGWRAWGFALASAFANWLYFRTLLRGYRESDLTLVYPVARGTGPLLSSLGAMWMLAEWPGVLTLFGLAATIGGLLLVAGGPALWRRAHQPGERQRVRAGLLWGGLTGACIAGYTLVDGYAVKVQGLSPLLFTYFCNLLRLPLMLPEAWRWRGELVAAWQRQWKTGVFVALLAPLAYMLVLSAVRLAPLSHVAPAREVSMLFAALLGGRLLGEADRGWRLAGAFCMALGVAALALG